MTISRSKPVTPTRRVVLTQATCLAVVGCAPATADDPLKPKGLIESGSIDGRDDPDEWHRLALFGNYDFIDEATFRRIAAMSTCDKATALALFWMHQPDYFLSFADRSAVPGVNLASWDLITAIRARWLVNGYRRAELAFDLATDWMPVDFAALERKHGAARVAAAMPVTMRGPLPGRRIGADGRRFPGVL